MKNIQTLRDNIYMGLVIARKDTIDALKNKNTLVNLIVVLGMVVFFYYMSTVRSFDKEIDVAVYDANKSNHFQGKVKLSDGYSLRFINLESQGQMERNMGFKELGIVVPSGFDDTLNSSNEAILEGYILWVYRSDVSNLEAKYSEKFSEYFQHPIHVNIGNRFFQPFPGIATSDTATHLLFATLMVAISLVPYFFVEEKRTKTLEALLVSPTSYGQIVLGKAFAGLFYVTLGCGLYVLFFHAYVVNWGLALLAYLCCGLFSIALALVLGSFIKNPAQMQMAIFPLVVILMVAAFFSQEPALSPVLKNILAVIPSSGLVRIYQFALSRSVPLVPLLGNLALVLGSSGLLYAMLVWRLRQSDR